MPPRCEKCGFMHYRTDSCRKLRAETRGQEPRINLETKGDDPPAHTSKPKRSGRRRKAK